MNALRTEWPGQLPQSQTPSSTRAVPGAPDREASLSRIFERHVPLGQHLAFHMVPPTAPALATVSPLQLPVAERQKLIFRLGQSLGEEAPSLCVEHTQGVAGGRACLVRTRIAVWTLEAYRRAGMTNQQLLDAFPTLRLPDLISAWCYVALHRTEIEQDILDNA